MGPIVDRSREILSLSDVAIVKARRMMLAALGDYEAGKLPTGSALAQGPVILPNPIDTVIIVGGEADVAASKLRARILAEKLAPRAFVGPW